MKKMLLMLPLAAVLVLAGCDSDPSVTYPGLYNPAYSPVLPANQTVAYVLLGDLAYAMENYNTKTELTVNNVTSTPFVFVSPSWNSTSKLETSGFTVSSDLDMSAIDSYWNPAGTCVLSAATYTVYQYRTAANLRATPYKTLITVTIKSCPGLETGTVFEMTWNNNLCTVSVVEKDASGTQVDVFQLQV